MFSAVSEDPEYYKDKISLFVALGPATKLTHIQKKFFKRVANHYEEIVGAWNILGINELMNANDKSSEKVKNLFCGSISDVCVELGEFFVSENHDLDDYSRFAVYMGHMPNGASVKQLKHYAQNMKEDRF